MMAKEGQTVQWPKRDRQYDGQRGTDNTMAKERQTIRWPKEIMAKTKTMI